MEEATEYKQDKAAKAVAKNRITNFSCGGMGIAVKGGKFEGVK